MEALAIYALVIAFFLQGLLRTIASIYGAERWR